MLYTYLADLVVLLHAFFVLFVLLGGFLVFWRPVLAWFHLPAVFWGAVVEFTGWICPLTPLENMLRTRGGGSGYATGFIEHHIMPLLYPASLTRNLQIVFGMIVLGVNFLIYLMVWRKLTKNQKKSSEKRKQM